MTAPDPAANPPPAGGANPPAPPLGTEPDDVDNGNSEAAKWRRQFRTAETERDAARAAVESLQRAVVEDQAARLGITKPSSLWAADGFDLAALLGDDNRPDPDKVAEAVKLAAESLGLQRRPGLPPAPNSGRGDTQPQQASWSEFLKKR